MTLSLQYGHVALISRCSVLTAVNWPQYGCLYQVKHRFQAPTLARRFDISHWFPCGMGTGLLLRAQRTRVHVELRQGSFSTFQISQSDSLNHYKSLWCYCILATKMFFFTPQPHQWTLGMIVWWAQKHTALKVWAVCVVIQELWKDQSYFYNKLNVLSGVLRKLRPSKTKT